MEHVLQDTQKQMSQAIVILKDDLATIRAGRANPQLIERLKIQAYDSAAELTLAELSTITASDAKTLVVSPFDQSIVQEIEKGIKQANLGVTVVRDGSVIRVITPSMTQERREEFVKLARTKTEGVHVMIRQARQEAMNKIKVQEQSGELSQDEKFRLEKEIQKLTDDKTKEADAILEAKITELETV